MMAACTSDSYPGLTYEYELNGEALNQESGTGRSRGEAVRAFISNQSFFTSVATRGTGPLVGRDTTLTGKNRYTKSTFYVFAFRDTPDEQGPLDYQPDLTKRSNDTGDSKANCLVDGYDRLMGMPTHLNADRSGELIMLKPDLRRDTTLAYGTRFTDIGYNFFTYWLDDFYPNEQNGHREQDRIWYEIPLDGARDLWYGSAPTLIPEVTMATMPAHWA